MSLPKLRLEVKLIIFFILISIIPLFINNLIWFNVSKNQIINTTSEQVKDVAKVAATDVDTFFTAKLVSLIIHSQTEAVLTQNLPVTIKELRNFLFQDSDIEQVQILNKDGKELLHITNQKIFQQTELGDESNSPAFKVTTFVGGEKYISTVRYENGNPYVDIAIPIIQPDTPGLLQTLTTSSIGRLRSKGEILGVLIAKVNLNALWHTLNDISVGENGYVFLIDDKGTVLTQPKGSRVPVGKNLQGVPVVDAYSTSIGDAFVRQEKNESGTLSLITYKAVTSTRWALIAQTPVFDTLREVNQIQLFASILFLIALVFIVIIAFQIANQIVEPIKQLQEGSRYIGTGNLTYRLQVHTGDELEELANAFNTMSTHLQDAFLKLELNKNIILAERNKMTLTLSNVADGIIAVDYQKRITIFNKAAEKLLGCSASEAIGAYIKDIMELYEDDQSIAVDTFCPVTLARGVEGISFAKNNLRLIGLHQKESTVNVISGRVKEGLSTNLGCIITLHDLTEEKELEKMKLDFVSIAAHELRTPLTTIKGYLSIFMEENAEHFDAERLMFLTRIQTATQQLSSLVENLLNVSRIEKGILTMNFEPVDWVGIVKEVMSEFTTQAKDKKVAIVFMEPQRSIPHVLADKMRIIEVIANLISNAIAYTPSGGIITVSVEQINQEVITHVQDTGIGIAEDAMHNLFTKFYRVEGKLTRGTKGTGLGLFISKSIVDMHHGRIWVDSVVGKGSTFSFSLPVADEKAWQKPVEKQ